jgi:hypothetical protein
MTPGSRPQSMPVFLLVKAAFQSLWRQRDDALRLGVIPTMVCFAGLVYVQGALRRSVDFMQSGTPDLISSGDYLTLLLSLLISGVAAAVLVANWLRFMLLGPMGAIGLGLTIGRPHVAFVVTCFILMFVFSIAFMVICMPLLLLPELLKAIGIGVAFIVVMVSASRLLLFGVGQAIGQPMSLQQAWSASRANGVQLASALILVWLPLWIVAVIVSTLLDALGFRELAPHATLFIAAVFQSAGYILQAIVLASAFRQMVGVQV